LWGDGEGGQEEQQEQQEQEEGGGVDEVLDEDPLGSHLAEPISFKRKQKQGFLSRGGRFFGFGSPGTAASERQPVSSTRLDAFFPPPPTNGTAHAAQQGARHDAAKDRVPLDWHVEGPGRRVGYEDLTAIDWIFEYTKERQRQRVLQSSTHGHGLLGHAQRLLDASQVWAVLVLTGLAVGALAAAIDVATDWLGDLKGGYCSGAHPRESGGAFYLSKTFCCMGHDDPSACVGWRPWAAALGVASAGGKWFLEYLFFVLFSVTLAVLAGVLVREFAMHAKHSGIPELKTVLGGFIIRRFLGAWTLVTKSLGLVRKTVRPPSSTSLSAPPSERLTD
jgi:chloride channel 3/4/5